MSLHRVSAAHAQHELCSLSVEVHKEKAEQKHKEEILALNRPLEELVKEKTRDIRSLLNAAGHFHGRSGSARKPGALQAPCPFDPVTS